jgi:hypothetical protein
MRAIAPCWGNARNRPKRAATHLPPAGLPKVHAEFFLAAGANDTNMRQCLSAHREATANDSNSLKVRRREDELATVQIKPDIFTLPRCTSAELFFSCCDSVAALALANCNERVAEANITAPAQTQSYLHGAQSPRRKSGKITYFSCSGYTRACHQHFLFPVPNCHTKFLTLLRFSQPSFLLRAPRLQAASSREIVHMQAGQCGSQMGTEF